jgi:hypothetical protein
MNVIRAISTAAVFCVLLLGAGGCCIPYGESYWATHFDGTGYNIEGDGTEVPNPLSGSCIISRGLPNGWDAIILGQGHDLSEIVIFCHLPVSPDAEFSNDTTGDGRAFQVWLVRDNLRQLSFDAKAGTAVSDLTNEQLHESTQAFQMVGSVRLKLKRDCVQKCDVDLRSVAPVSYVPDGREWMTTRPWIQHDRRPLEPPDHARLQGIYRGGWGRDCRPWPFI